MDLHSIIELIGYRIPAKPAEVIQKFQQLRYDANTISLEGKNIIIPLSGGYDSRFCLLNFVLEYVQKGQKCFAYTYGAYDSLDLRLATEVASICGVPLVRDVLEEVLDEKIEADYLSRNTTNMVKGNHPTLKTWDYAVKDKPIVISGLFGDTVTGAKADYDKGVDDFWRRQAKKNNCVLEETQSLQAYSNTLIGWFNAEFPNSQLTNHEILDLLIRESYQVLEHVSFDKSIGYWYPFLSDEFFIFYVSLPAGDRRNQRLYRSNVQLLNRSRNLQHIPFKSDLQKSYRQKIFHVLYKHIFRRSYYANYAYENLSHK
jgi:asparagine synthetase B (glutamine-hydrolysing)